MERILLGVLCLSGWNISSCLPSQYHYVADPMSWTEAQTYCREKYSDLATIESPEEMEKINKTVLSSSLNVEVWIGVYSKIEWKWSDGYKGSGADYRNWEATENEPDFYSGNQFCVDVKGDGRWWDWECSRTSPFICYRGTQHDPKFVFVNKSLDWSSAQRHCRKNFIDLATVRNNTENQKIDNLRPSGDSLWIGLYRDADFFWSDGSGFSFRNWESGSHPFGSMSVVCGVADLQGSGRWKLIDCETKHPFVCYSIPPPPPATRQVIKLKVKPEDSSVDLNDPAVKADILKKLQDKLKDNGLSGVTLKWREQPDGKVFHKERGSQKKNHKTEL